MRTRGAAGPGGDADDPVDDEIREQEAMDADEGELYFGPEQFAEGVLYLLDSSAVDASAGKPYQAKNGAGGWPTPVQRVIDPANESNVALRAFLANETVIEMDAAMAAALSAGDFSYEGESPSFAKSNGESMLGVTWSLDRNGNVRGWMVWQLRLSKLVVKNFGYQGSQVLSVGVDRMFGAATRYLVVSHKQIAAHDKSSSGEAAMYEAAVLVLSARGLMHWAVQSPLGLNVMNSSVRAALQRSVDFAEGKGKKHRLAHLLELADGAELPVRDYDDAFRQAVSNAVKVAKANLSPEAQAAHDANKFKPGLEDRSPIR